jgi:hypothetical protein
MNIIDAWLNNPWAFFGSLGIAGAGAVYLAYRFFGLKGAGVALAVLGALAALRNARKGGYEARVREDERVATNSLDRANRARSRAKEDYANEVQDFTPSPSAPEPAGRPSRVLKPDPNDRATRRKRGSV